MRGAPFGKEPERRLVVDIDEWPDREASAGREMGEHGEVVDFDLHIAVGSKIRAYLPLALERDRGKQG